MALKPGVVLKRLLSGLFLMIPMAFVGVLVSLFTIGLKFPPTNIQLMLIGLGAVSGFMIGFGIPKVSAAVLSFLSLLTGGGDM